MTKSTTAGWTIRERRDRAALVQGIAEALAGLAAADECPPQRRGLLWRHARDIGELGERIAGRGIDPDDPAAADGWARELTGLGPQAAALGRELAGIAVQLTSFHGPPPGNPPGNDTQLD